MTLHKLREIAEVKNYHAFYHVLLDSNLDSKVKDDLIELMLYVVSYPFMVGMDTALVDEIDDLISKQE